MNLIHGLLRRDPAKPFSVTFEELMAQMETFEFMFVELDGSFVWRGFMDSESGTSTAPTPVWQIDGVIGEQMGAVAEIDCKLQFENSARDSIVSALGQLTAALDTAAESCRFHHLQTGEAENLAELLKQISDPTRE